MKEVAMKYLNQVKICGKDVYGKKFTINTTIELAKHYNTVNANYWQRIITNEGQKWKLIFQN